MVESSTNHTNTQYSTVHYASVRGVCTSPISEETTSTVPTTSPVGVQYHDESRPETKDVGQKQEATENPQQ